MASNRTTAIANLVTLLTGITGIASVQAGQDWPETEQHLASELPMLWIKTPDQSAQVNPQQYRLDDQVLVRVYRLDWSTQPAFSTADGWIEKIVEKVESNPDLTDTVQFIEYQGSRMVLRNFPIAVEEVEFKMVSHVSFTNL